MTGPDTLPMLMAWSLAALAAIMAAAWLFQMAARNTGWVDVFWTFGTGAVAAAAAEWPMAADQPFAPRAHLVAVLVGLWAIRLGLYIALRVVRSSEEDARYAGFRKDWGRAYQAKLIFLVAPQPLVSIVLVLAVALAARAEGPFPGARDALAVAIWLIAVIGEGLADAQMGRFRSNPANRGKVCEDGLWAWSRHPNYFFEWVVWWAYPVVALKPDAPLTWLTLGAPLVMYLILRYASGVPPLEKVMLASRGDLFRDYQARVSAFFPLPPRRRSAAAHQTRA